MVCHYVECLYADCRFDECRGAKSRDKNVDKLRVENVSARLLNMPVS